MHVQLQILFIFLIFFYPKVSAQPMNIESYRSAKFPTPPKKENRLFFLQRNLNFDTIIYDLNHLPDNSLNQNNPLDVFYLRYTSGQRAELNWIERQFAYGYDAIPIKGTDNFEIVLNAYAKRKIQLQKQGNRYIAVIRINNKLASLSNIFIQADETSFWPTVYFIELFGEDLETGEQLFEKFQP